MKLRVVSNVAPPAPRRSYPWEEMAVNDSFHVPVEESSVHQVINSLRVTAARAGRRLGRKFSVRQAQNGIRVWRVK